MRIASSGFVGIGTSSPAALLSVGNNTSSLVAVFGGGSGKIDVGTIDPVYTIGGKSYATYVPAMTGVKEETTGIAALSCVPGESRCGAVLDFRGAPAGSDLWLFAKTTNLRKNFDRMTVLLTPNFDGRAWYEKDAARETLTIFGSASGKNGAPFEVSYRLTAPRFDADQWTNESVTHGSVGFVLD
jgi:hypothetical protein